MSPRRLPPWHELVTLPNGRELLIRPIRPEDEAPLQATFTLLQPEEIRQRFLYSMKELNPAMAARLVRPNAKTEFALVAAEPLPPGEALIGAVARISIDPASNDAEYAILVSHYIAGMGLGRLLMRKIVRWARNRKLRRVYGEVLGSNLPMLHLAHTLGFRRQYSDAPGLVRVVLDLAGDNGSESPGPGGRSRPR